MTNNDVQKTYYFYRISCLNKSITDCYIGSTINFTKRISVHKCMCKNPKYNHLLKKLYDTINANGGWSNWSINIIDRKKCCKIDALIHENKLMEDYSSTLNKNRAYITEEQKLELNEVWREEHKDQVKATVKKWKENNPEYFKNWRENNKDKIKEYKKKQYQKSLEKKNIVTATTAEIKIEDPIEEIQIEEPIEEKDESITH